MQSWICLYTLRFASSARNFSGSVLKSAAEIPSAMSASFAKGSSGREGRRILTHHAWLQRRGSSQTKLILCAKTYHESSTLKKPLCQGCLGPWLHRCQLGAGHLALANCPGGRGCCLLANQNGSTSVDIGDSNSPY
jgi:hypothetical protein